MKQETGFSLIELLIVVTIIAIIAAIAIPSLQKSRQAANEASAIAAVRHISTTQAKWQATNGKGRDFAASLADLGGEFLIDDKLASGAKSGFAYSCTGVPTSASPTGASYFDLTASPMSTGKTGTGTRSFYCNETYVIFYQAGSVPGVWGTTPFNRQPASPAAPLE